MLESSLSPENYKDQEESPYAARTDTAKNSVGRADVFSLVGAQRDHVVDGHNRLFAAGQFAPYGVLVHAAYVEEVLPTVRSHHANLVVGRYEGAAAYPLSQLVGR